MGWRAEHNRDVWIQAFEEARCLQRYNDVPEQGDLLMDESTAWLVVPGPVERWVYEGDLPRWAIVVLTDFGYQRTLPEGGRGPAVSCACYRCNSATVGVIDAHVE